MGKEGDSDSGDEFCQNINAPTTMPCDKCNEAGPAGCAKCKKKGIVEADDLSPRYKRAISIILDAEPDLVSVQECDRAEQFTTFMQDAGYGVYFNKKTASATTRVGVGMDCVGIFYNKRTFKKVYGPRKIFLPNVKKGSSSTVGKQAAMWLLLRRRETGRPVAVVTAHLKSGKEAGEDGLIKQVQAARMAEILKKELGANVPIIFGCDFNNGTETKSYDSFRKEVPFMAEAYEDVYGRSPLWGSSKWRSGGGQTHKIGHTPNNIDYIFYTRQFFNTLSVLAYPEEDLETCNLPGFKYPSDHFAHMATFQERDEELVGGNKNIALLEEMFHLLMRENTVPSTDTIIRDAEGKQVRVDYTYDCDSAERRIDPSDGNGPYTKAEFVAYYGEEDGNAMWDTASRLAPKKRTRENMLAVFDKCRPFYTELIRSITPSCGECNGRGTIRVQGEGEWSVSKPSQCKGCEGSGLPDAENKLLSQIKQKVFGADDETTYINYVRIQAKKMNTHNKQRNKMEKEGEKYRTYTILKALYNLKGAEGKNINKEKGAKAVYDATVTNMLGFIKDKICSTCKSRPVNDQDKADIKIEVKRNEEWVKCTVVRPPSGDDDKVTVRYNADEEFEVPLANARVQDRKDPKLGCKACKNVHNFGKAPKKYKKMNDLPITIQELEEHLETQREKIIQKFGLKEIAEAKCPSDLRRRLADAARMEEKDMDDMSPSQLALHRRRLAHGAHVSPVLAALMDEIEQAQRNY